MHPRCLVADRLDEELDAVVALAVRRVVGIVIVDLARSAQQGAVEAERGVVLPSGYVDDDTTQPAAMGAHMHPSTGHRQNGSPMGSVSTAQAGSLVTSSAPAPTRRFASASRSVVA